MATKTSINTDYLKFDAFSIKELIKQKLSEDSTFTDYVYDGSNLAILIDIFSNMFQVLLYNLNHTAAESMFTDTQIYENMNRLVKFIGYNPRGYITSNVLINANYSGVDQGIIVPPYSSIKLNKNDKNGNPIYFSTVDYYYLYTSSSTVNNTFTLYNGQWLNYNTTFTAEGLPYEKFVLDTLVSDTSNITPTYISYPYIHVYVKRLTDATSGKYETIRFNPNTDGLFVDTTNSSIYDSSSKIFNLRLNEYKQYEIQFGDGIHGESLKSGDIVNVVYMKSNGPDGVIELGDINSTEFTIGIGTLNTDPAFIDTSVLSMQDILNCLFQNSLVINANKTSTVFTGITNLSKSTVPTNEEDVEQIKTNAPQWFKSVGRVITAKDFEYFIKSNFYNDIIDIKIMNNWEYICSFYKWLYIQGLNSISTKSATKYINSNLTSNYGYKYADAADSNNIYIWLKAKNESSSLINEIENSLRPIKPLTSEPVCIYPIKKVFFPCAYFTPGLTSYKDISGNYDINSWDENKENYIEIEIQKNVLLSIEAIRSNVVTYIEEYFSQTNQKIGGLIDLNQLNSYILGIPGIKNVRTVYVNPLVPTDIKYINGLSFACWTPTIINGEDLSITNSSFTLESFQFAELASNNLNDYVKVITETTFQTGQPEY